MPKVAQQARQGRAEQESGLPGPDRRGVKMWVPPFPPISPLSNQAPNGCRGPGAGPGGNRVEKKLRVLSITAKRGSVPPPPSFPAFNLITAPHSPNRSRLQLELFARAALSSFPSPTGPSPAWRPLPVAPNAPPSASSRHSGPSPALKATAVPVLPGQPQEGKRPWV